MNSFIRIIDGLNARGVQYVVVGGFAAYIHGSRRVTFDLDLVVDLRPDEARKAIEALLAVGLQSRLPVDPLMFADAKERSRWIAEKNMIVFTLVDPASPGFAVDLFVDSPIDFSTLFSNARTIEIEGRRVCVCSVDDLIEMKTRAGRPQDLLDVEALRRLK